MEALVIFGATAHEALFYFPFEGHYFFSIKLNSNVFPTKIKLTFYKAVEPLDVWIHRAPFTVTNCRVQDTVIASPIQGCVQNKCI